jgi:Ca-activated chloride channel family protein
MYRAAVLVLAVLTLAPFAPDAFGQGRPRRVDPSQTVPPPVDDTRRAPAAPGASTGGDDDGDAVSLEGALIEVPVVVADRSGHYVPRLGQQDFRVLEDGVEQQITFFSDQRVPIHVALVVDTSGSTRDTLGDIQQAAIDFIGQLLPGDQVMIVSFASEVIVEQEFTSDRRLLSQAIQRTQPNGSTKLYEAVYLTVAERLRQVEGRKAMIILSDGEDTASRDVSFDEAVNVCSESDVVAYGIRYPESSGLNVYTGPGGNGGNWPFPGGGGGGRRGNGGGNTGPYPPNYPQPRRTAPRVNIPGIPWPKWPLVPTGSSFVDPQFGGRNSGQQYPAQGGGMGQSRFMETITSNSGGTLFYADQVGNVSSLLGMIAEELRHVYVIGYSPSNALDRGGYRRITVQVPRQPDLAVRHRLGYQAEAYK